jgi:gelsolin
MEQEGQDIKPALMRTHSEPVKKKNPFIRSVTRELCHECNKAIYAAERQVVGKFTFHRLCAGIYIEKDLKKAPVFSISEEKNANKNNSHYQSRETKFLSLQLTNIGGLGSKAEKEVKLRAALGEPAWLGVGQDEGLKIWRIEKFKVVAVLENNYGSFFEGDSYIVLNAMYKGIDQQKKRWFSWDVHFWLGAHTSQDEAGTAAYKTVELCDVLNGPSILSGGSTVQHREVMGYESHSFLKLFEDKGGVRIMEGGIESGFRIVKPQEYKPRLLWIKGRKNVRVVQVPIVAESMNSGDVFVLDTGLDLYQWQGFDSAPPERLRAALLCRAIDDERAGKPRVHVIDELDSGNLDANVATFWERMGYKGVKQAIKSGDGVVGDMEWEKVSEAELKLFRLSDASGEMRFSLEATGRLVTEDKLDHNDVMILDAGCEIFVWIGKGATEQERRGGMDAAYTYMKGAGRPDYLPVTKILDGGENETFRSFFLHQ